MRTFHRFTQREAMWHLVRIGKLTSSEMKRIMAKGKGAETYLDEILLKIDLLKSVHAGNCDYEDAFDQFDKQTRAMAIGTELEAKAKVEFSERMDKVVDEIGFIEFTRYPIGASTDGLVGDDGILEVKVPNSKTHRETCRNGVLPREHVIQVQSELWISGKSVCYFVSYDHRMPVGMDLFVLPVERDESKIQEIMDVAIPFAERIPKDPFDFDLNEIAMDRDFESIELNFGNTTDG